MSKFILDEEQQARVATKLQAALEEELNDIYDADFSWGDSTVEQTPSEDDDFARQLVFTALYNEDVDLVDEEAAEDE